MAIIRDVHITLIGQVPDDRWNNEYEVLIAELNLLAKRYGLNLEKETK